MRTANILYSETLQFLQKMEINSVIKITAITLIISVIAIPILFVASLPVTGFIATVMGATALTILILSLFKKNSNSLGLPDTELHETVVFHTVQNMNEGEEMLSKEDKYIAIQKRGDTMQMYALYFWNNTRKDFLVSCQKKEIFAKINELYRK